MKRIKKEKAKHRTGLIKRLTRDNKLLTRDNERFKVSHSFHRIFVDDSPRMFMGGCL